MYLSTHPNYSPPGDIRGRMRPGGNMPVAFDSVHGYLGVLRAGMTSCPFGQVAIAALEGAV